METVEGILCTKHKKVHQPLTVLFSLKYAAFVVYHSATSKFVHSFNDSSLLLVFSQILITKGNFKNLNPIKRNRDKS